MGQELIIVGASGLGKEVLWLAERVKIKVQGFLDDSFNQTGKTHCGLPVLGSINDAPSFSGASFVIAIGKPRARKSIVERLQRNGIDSFITLIDPTATIGPTVSVGRGSIIFAGATATVDVEIGLFTLLDQRAMISHDSTIGNFTTIAPQACLSGNVTTGELVEIGSCAAIRQNLILGKGSMLGMGAVLVRDLKENEVAVGNPAKTLRFAK